MLKKAMMITLYIVIGYQAQAIYSVEAIMRAPASEKSARAPKSVKNICMIKAGDIGTVKYKGTSYEDAFSKVTDRCFQLRNDAFVKREKHYPDQDRQIQFAEACVNNINCI